MCAGCGGAVAIFVSSGRPHKYCSERCSTRTQQQTRRLAHIATLSCANCGGSITGRAKKYCSDSCRRARDLAVHKAKYIPRPRTVRASPVYDIECAWCGNTFRTGRKGRVVCSRSCSASLGNTMRFRGEDISHGHRARALHYGARYEPVNPLHVFDRDNWLCALCGDPVDPALKWPNPFSASMDHTVPLSKGGDHLLANLRCTHLRCNIRKGAKIDVRSAPEAERAETTAR